MRAHIRAFNWDDLRTDHAVDQPVHLVMVIGPLAYREFERYSLRVAGANMSDSAMP